MDSGFENLILNINFFIFKEILSMQYSPLEIILYSLLSNSKYKENSLLPFLIFPLYSWIIPP